MADLDSGGCSDMRTVYLQGYSFQSRTLWTVCHYSHIGIQEMEEDDATIRQ